MKLTLPSRPETFLDWKTSVAKNGIHNPCQYTFRQWVSTFIKIPLPPLSFAGFAKCYNDNLVKLWQEKYFKYMEK